MFQIFEIDRYDNEFEKSVDVLIPGFSRYLHNGGNTVYKGFLDDETPDGTMYKYILENRMVPYYAAVNCHIPLLKHQLMFSEYGDFNANHDIIGKGNMEVLLLVNSKIKEVDEYDMTFSINSARLNVFKWAKNKNIQVPHGISYSIIKRALKNGHKYFIIWYKQNYY